jgi:hypothetical protein
MVTPEGASGVRFGSRSGYGLRTVSDVADAPPRILVWSDYI